MGKKKKKEWTDEKVFRILIIRKVIRIELGELDELK
jgi:hypothetical protein